MENKLKEINSNLKLKNLINKAVTTANSISKKALPIFGAAIIAVAPLNAKGNQYPTATRNSVSNEYVNQLPDHAKYNSQKVIEIAQEISNSEYKKMSEYKYFEKDVQKNITSMLNKLNQETLEYTRCLDSYENDYIINNVVPLLVKYKIIDQNADSKQINYILNKIIENDYKDQNGKTLPADLVVAMVNIVTQNYVQKSHDTLTLISSGADEAQIIKKVDGDGHNEVYADYIKIEQMKLINKDGKEPNPKERNILKETENFLTTVEDSIVYGFCRFAHENRKFYKNTTDNRIIAQKLNKLKNSVSNNNQINKAELDQLVTEIANMLPAEQFGENIEMRKAAIGLHVARHATTEVLKNLENLNYNVNSKENFLFGFQAGYKLTNKEQGATFGAKGVFNFNNGISTSLGLNGSYLFEETPEENVEKLQLMANAGIYKTFNNRHTIGANIYGGAEVNKYEFNPLVGLDIEYVQHINEILFVGVRGTALTNTKDIDITAGILAGFRFGKVYTTLTGDFGGNIAFNQKQNTPQPDPNNPENPKNPENPDDQDKENPEKEPPIIGDDEIKDGSDDNPTEEEEIKDREPIFD